MTMLFWTKDDKFDMRQNSSSAQRQSEKNLLMSLARSTEFMNINNSRALGYMSPCITLLVS